MKNSHDSSGFGSKVLGVEISHRYTGNRLKGPSFLYLFIYITLKES